MKSEEEMLVIHWGEKRREEEERGKGEGGRGEEGKGKGGRRMRNEKGVKRNEKPLFKKSFSEERKEQARSMTCNLEVARRWFNLEKK